jgi:uncharacterized protein (TIGR01244 family)
MTQTRKLTEQLSVAPFVPPAEVTALAGRFAMLVNNRPDGEEPGQPSSAEIAAAAAAAGMNYAHIPVVVGNISDEQINAFADAVGAEQGPVLAFCRSGMRSTMLRALSQAGKRSLDDILETAKAAAYDLTPLAANLRERAAA